MIPAFGAFCLYSFSGWLLKNNFMFGFTLFRFDEVLWVLGTEQLGLFGGLDASPAPSFRGRAETLELNKVIL